MAEHKIDVNRELKKFLVVFAVLHKIPLLRPSLYAKKLLDYFNI